MSKLYIPLLAVALAGSASAQQNTAAPAAAKKSRFEPVRTAVRPVINAADREIIWSDDFSNASTWVTGTALPEGVTSVDADTWVIGTEGPAGSFAIDPIASTSAANGFALFDSDLYCGGNQSATVTMATGVDLSGYTGVILQFEQFFRQFRGQCFVDVSVGGSDTWTAFEVNEEIDVNSATDNPALKVVNITSAAAGFSDVKIRFRYWSTIAEHGAQGGCDYAWMVDDVAFTTLPDNEIQLLYGYTSITGTGEEYGRTPVNQFGPTLNIGGEAFNFGGLEQTGVSVSCEITGPTTASSGPLAIGTLASQTSAIADFDLDFAPQVGDYSASFEVTSDQIALDGNTEDNVRIRTFAATNDIFSLDFIGGHPEGEETLQQNGTGSFADNSENVKLMTMYTLRAPYPLTGIQIELGPASGVGGQVVVSILDTTEVLATPPVTNNPVNGLESEPYTLTQADIDAGIITVGFDVPENFELPVGTYYACAAMTKVGEEGEVYILDDLTVPQPALGSVLWLPFDPDNVFLYGGNGTAYAIRLTSQTGIGMAENTLLEGVTMYPNPTNGLVRVNTVGNEKMTVEVMNILGELVSTSKFVGNTVLDLEGLADGVYSVRVSNGAKTAVQRITLQ
ncbi:MAG: T9SS type A sorting domain-containing protein [Flavobacteriales bacterium]|nr:T9SS type A sorting domain-containing protein [Flavobacteriales bacterium]